MNLSYLERIPFSLASHYFRRLFQQIHSSTVEVLLTELEYLHLDTSIIHDLFDELDKDPRVSAGLLIAGPGLHDVLARRQLEQFNFEIIQGTYEEDGYYHPGFDEEIPEGKLSIDGRLLEHWHNKRTVKKGRSTYFFRTITSKTKNIPRHLLDWDNDLGTVLMTPDGFYFQRADDYLTRTRQIDFNATVGHRMKVGCKTLLGESESSEQQFVHFHSYFVRLSNTLCIYVQERLKKVNIEIDGRKAANRSSLWYDCIMFYNLEIYRPISLVDEEGRERVNMVADYWFLRNELIKREMSQYKFGQRRQYGTLDYPKVHRIYPTLASWKLRHYNVDPSGVRQTLTYYEGKYDLNEIRQHFGV